MFDMFNVEAQTSHAHGRGGAGTSPSPNAGRPTRQQTQRFRRAVRRNRSRFRR